MPELLGVAPTSFSCTAYSAMEPSAVAGLLTGVGVELVATASGLTAIAALDPAQRAEILASRVKTPSMKLAKRYWKAMSALEELQEQAEASVLGLNHRLARPLPSPSDRVRAARERPFTLERAVPRWDPAQLQLVPYVPLVATMAPAAPAPPPLQDRRVAPAEPDLPGALHQALNGGRRVVEQYLESPLVAFLLQVLCFCAHMAWYWPILLGYFLFGYFVLSIVFVARNPWILVNWTFQLGDYMVGGAPSYMLWATNNTTAQVWVELTARLR